MLLDVGNLQVSLTDNRNLIHDLSFKLDDGEMLSIVGSSGAGKTTVCKALMGLLDAGYRTSGKLSYQGNNLLGMPRKKLNAIYGKEICLIMQNPMTAFNPSIPVGRQLYKTYSKHNEIISKQELTNKLQILLRKFGLGDTQRIMKNFPFELSGGMLQRLMLVAALINQPKVLIADEVTTATDACNRVELMEQLRVLCKEGMAVLLVTHNLRDAAYSDKILIMNQGTVVEAGKTDKVLEHPREDYTKYLLSASCLERSLCG